MFEKVSNNSFSLSSASLRSVMSQGVLDDSRHVAVPIKERVRVDFDHPLFALTIVVNVLHSHRLLALFDFHDGTGTVMRSARLISMVGKGIASRFSLGVFDSGGRISHNDLVIVGVNDVERVGQRFQDGVEKLMLPADLLPGFLALGDLESEFFVDSGQIYGSFLNSLFQLVMGSLQGLFGPTFLFDEALLVQGSRDDGRNQIKIPVPRILNDVITCSPVGWPPRQRFRPPRR